MDDTNDFSGITETFTNILSNVGALGTAYFNNLAAINAAKYGAQQAALGTPAQQAASGANAALDSLSVYMPYLIGAIALIGVGSMMRK